MLDPAAHLDSAMARQLAVTAGLIPVALAQPLDAEALRDALDDPGEGAGLLMYGGSLSLEQAQDLDVLLDDLDMPLHLVLELAADPRPLDQRLSAPLSGDSPSAAHYRQRGLLHRLWPGADEGAIAAAAGYMLADAVRTRHPELEAVFPPEVIPRVMPEAPLEAPVEMSEKAVVPPPLGAAAQEEDAGGAPAWRRSAQQRGRIKRRSPGAGGRAGRGWKPKS